MSEDGEIKQSVQFLKKASEKVILKIYSEYEIKQAEKANAFLTDFLISKFADLLGGLDAVESSEELEKELAKDKLLRRDLKSMVEKNYLPIYHIWIFCLVVSRLENMFCLKIKKDDENNEKSQKTE